MNYIRSRQEKIIDRIAGVSIGILTIFALILSVTYYSEVINTLRGNVGGIMFYSFLILIIAKEIYWFINLAINIFFGRLRR